jgi:hypothetical protein
LELPHHTLECFSHSPHLKRFLKIPLQVSYSFEKQELKSTAIRKRRNRIESYVQEDWKVEEFLEGKVFGTQKIFVYKCHYSLMEVS